MNTVFQPQTPFLRNIKKVIVFCAVILIAAIVTELFLIQSLLAKREKDAYVINTAGHQRTLSQKITKNLYAYHHDRSLAKELENDAEDWKETHKSLQEKDNDIIGKDKVQAKIDSLFTAINPYQEKLYRTVMNVHEFADIGESKESIKEWEHGFLAGMDELVNLYQEQSEKAIFRLELIVTTVLCIFYRFNIGHVLFPDQSNNFFYA